MYSTRALLFTATVMALAGSARAGGPMVFADDGSIVKWPATASSANVVLTLDQGGLGILTNAQANALVADVIGVWNGVVECKINLSISPTPLSEDINETNYLPVLWTGFPHGYNPVVYDVNGLVLDSMFGLGMRNQVLGYAGPIFDVDPSPPGHPLPGDIIEGQILLNGRFLDGVNNGAANPEVSQAEFEGVIVHEMGHMLGLDHSQINGSDPTNDDQPTMFPIFHGGTALRSLAPDDMAWIAYLYPQPSFATTMGTISGGVLQRSGASNVGFQGLNVIARTVGGTRIDAISCVSGYLYRSGYSPSGLVGTYILPGVPPGDYTVEIEAINPSFTGKSSVGPLDPPATFPPPAGPEFYNGVRESAYDNPSEKTNVPAVAGVTTSNINIILNTEEQPAMTARTWIYLR